MPEPKTLPAADGRRGGTRNATPHAAQFCDGRRGGPGRARRPGAG